MSPDLKSKLVTALRSGEYKQTTGQLRDTSTGCMCVMGVACEVSGEGEWDDDPEWGNVGVYKVKGTGEKAKWVLPPSFYERGFITEDESDTLMDKNDSDAVSFVELADYIETHC